jgi:ankyrin repeat protein
VVLRDVNHGLYPSANAAFDNINLQIGKEANCDAIPTAESNVETIGNELEGQTNRNLQRGHPLLITIDTGSDMLVRMMVQKGANVDAADHQGRYPLMVAIEKDFDMLARMMVQKGANLTVRDHRGRSALLMAIDGGLDMLARLLVQKGADVDAADHQGNPKARVATFAF